jgi:hypothetical protein
MLGAVVGIISQLTTFEASTGLDRGSVPHRCPGIIVGAILLLIRSAGCLLMETLRLLKRTL